MSWSVLNCPFAEMVKIASSGIGRVVVGIVKSPKEANVVCRFRVLALALQGGTRAHRTVNSGLARTRARAQG